ncbi:MAG: haloacid dehalogenase type II [Phycisphaerales bacterium]
MTIDPDSIDAITFDCFGTLIDWPSGILAVLRPMNERYNLGMPDAELLTRYAEIEREIESGPYRPYRDVLERVMRRMFSAAPSYEFATLADAVATWRPFPDTLDALRRLKSRYRLGVLSNIDDDLFAPILDKLERSFDAVVTAEQVRSYKPADPQFTAALGRLELAPDRVLHAAESRFHDIDPARRLGFRTAWINRGQSASGPSSAQPDLTVSSAAELCAALGLD